MGDWLSYLDNLLYEISPRNKSNKVLVAGLNVKPNCEAA